MAKKTKKSKKGLLTLKLRQTPWYWKIVFTIIVIFGGGTMSTQLFTANSDLEMCVGFVLMVFFIWLLIQLWWPVQKNDEQ